MWLNDLWFTTFVRSTILLSCTHNVVSSEQKHSTKLSPPIHMLPSGNIY